VWNCCQLSPPESQKCRTVVNFGRWSPRSVELSSTLAFGILSNRILNKILLDNSYSSGNRHTIPHINTHNNFASAIRDSLLV